MNNAQQRPLIVFLFTLCIDFFIRFVAYLHISTDIKNIRSLGTRFTVQHSTVAISLWCTNLRSLNDLFRTCVTNIPAHEGRAKTVIKRGRYQEFTED